MSSGRPRGPWRLREVENFRGCSVTVPHKTAMMALVDNLTPRAAHKHPACIPQPAATMIPEIPQRQE